MLVALVTVGVGLIVFGGLVLLRFPDRPGGELRLRGACGANSQTLRGKRVQSLGAGLSVVVLGLLTVVFAAVRIGTASPATTVNRPGTCLAAHLDLEHSVNKAFQQRLPAGQTIRITAEVDYVLILTDGVGATGAVRFQYAGATGELALAIHEVVDASCRPGAFTTEKIANGFIVQVALADRTYELSLTYVDHPVSPNATLRRTG